jgi:hypothetical protein
VSRHLDPDRYVPPTPDQVEDAWGTNREWDDDGCLTWLFVIAAAAVLFGLLFLTWWLR